MKFFRRIRNICAGFLLSVAFAGTGQTGEVSVFAAASLREALDSVATNFAALTGHEVTASYAGSPVLARQIEHGAPADIYISASSDWMDHLQRTGHIATGSRIDLLGNRLVLIGPAPQEPARTIGADTDLSAMLAGGLLAMALTDAVPAGIYGKAALEHLNLWQMLAPSVAETDNVRAALALVAMKAAPLGIVYATDAAAEPRVAIIGVFPQDSHPEIVYPAALTTSSRAPEARAFLDYLVSEAAHDVFERHGFSVRAE